VAAGDGLSSTGRAFGASLYRASTGDPLCFSNSTTTGERCESAQRMLILRYKKICLGVQNSDPCAVNELCVACMFVMLRQEMRGYVLQLPSQLRWSL
jgi:hypothetical protein